MRTFRHGRPPAPIGATVSMALHAAMIGALAASDDEGLAPLVRWGLLLLLVLDGLTIATAFRQPPPGIETRRAGTGAGPQPGSPAEPGAARGPGGPTRPPTDRPAPTEPQESGIPGGTISAGAGYGPVAGGLGRPPRPDRRAHRRELHGPLLDEAGMAEAVRRARSGRQAIPHALVVADLGAASGWEAELGPGAAERLYHAVAGVIRSAVRSTATAVGRDGQGRFVVHLSGLTKGLPATEAIVVRVADALATPVMVQDTLLSVSARFGVGLCVCGRCEYERLQELAARPAPGPEGAPHPARGPVITRCRPIAGRWEAASH